MFRNYLKITFRGLWKNKVFSAINISGLAIGMSSALLIFLWMQNEWSMDRFHKNEKRIYLMYNRDKDSRGETWAWPNTPKILASTLKKDYPEVEDVIRFNNITFLLSAGEKKLNKRGAFVDSGFLNIFSFPLLEGSPKNILKGSYSMVLTEKLAKALFGNEDAVGKIVRVDSVNNCTVTGVLKDLPGNTQFDFEYLLSWNYMHKLGWDDENWDNNSVKTYVLLKQGASASEFDSKIKDITINHTKGSPAASTTEVFTQPLSRAYLYAKSGNGKLVGGQIVTVRLFGIIAAFILLIACINFMNLSTARSEKRAKEVGIRKVVGAQKYSLVFQFLGESILISVLAFVIALFIVQISLGSFNQLVGKQLSIDYTNPLLWTFSLLFILFTGALAGSYPAFYLSAFRPVKVLKGAFKKANALITPRKALVTVQFTFAIILIISTIIVARQINYGAERQSGYNQNNLVYLFTQGDVDKHYQAIKNELLSSGVALSVTHSANPITQRWGDSWGFQWKGSTKADEKIDFLRMGSDAGFVKTMGLKLVGGRDIDIYNYPTDSNAILLNEAAVRAMHVKDPIGLTMHYTGDTNMFHVVGVIHDFIIESPFQKEISPMIVFGPGLDYFQVVHIRLNPEKPASAAIAGVQEIFKKYNPMYPPEYVFADESYAKKFKEAERTGTLAALFAGLTIFISCMGLFGLATYMAESRIKEIGVRKVLGASVIGITSLLSRDFLKLVLVSFVIAAPIAWWAMSKWLDSYTYRIQMEWWVFLFAGIISLIIAMVTVSFQAIRAAIANPIKSLRTE
ncbi:MAG: ABC transporter permease [Chitinophagaceae bacterium]|nr:ABC transporter permease [Chitinophagaceae bacterium]